jgi:di/tricarboxylate transporter
LLCLQGLNSYEADELNKMNERIQRRHLVEAVVARKGPLVGKTVRDVQFRTQYDAAVIAVHREGQRIHELISNIRLQAGDVLLMEVGDAFMSRKSKLDSTFVLMAQVKDSSPPRFRMLLPALFLTVAAYGCYVAKLSTLFGTGLAAAILMVMVGVLTEAEAREAIRWEIFLTIAPAFGVGQALINSGVAAAVASFLVSQATSSCCKSLWAPSSQNFFDIFLCHFCP